MSDEAIFSAASGIAFIGWLVLLIFPFRPFTSRLVIGTVITLLCATYAVLLFQTLQPTDFQKFSTLAGVTSLLGTPGAMLVGWIHYLAFDLLAGLFIAHNAAKHGVSHIVIIPCLLLTFMMGPVGLLLFLIIRWAVSRQYFAENF
jgi:hypothetical protein